MAHAPDAELVADWHAVADVDGLAAGGRRTRLLGTGVTVSRSRGGVAARDDAGRALAARERYGLAWVCLGEPAADIVDIPEASEAGRHVVTGGAAGVHASGLRVVENFLDMGHFPFVHAGYLGEEPRTEVAGYRVAPSADGGLVATGCRFHQPVASPTAAGGIVAEYTYHVLRPYSVALRKTNPVQPHRSDFIALFVQPVDEERCVAHSLLCYVADGVGRAEVRWFMQLIFAQDKPILENQTPRRLPLGGEVPVRADAASVHYRRWLGERGIAYGTAPP